MCVDGLYDCSRAKLESDDFVVRSVLILTVLGVKFAYDDKITLPNYGGLLYVLIKLIISPGNQMVWRQIENNC